MQELIEVFLIEEPNQAPRSHRVDAGKTVDILIREIFPQAHQEIDLFIEGETTPRERHHRLHDVGVRHGHRIHFHRRHHHGHHEPHHHHPPQHPRLFLDTKDSAREFTAPKNPMSGQELRMLFQVPSNYDLWKKIHGKDDVRIAPHATIELVDCEHFYTAPSELNPGAF